MWRRHASPSRCRNTGLLHIVNSGQPLRVVLDPQARLAPPRKLFDDGLPTLMVVRADAKAYGWTRDTVEVLRVPAGPEGRLGWRPILEGLAKRGCFQVLVEGGGTTVTRLLEESAADRLVVYIGPKLLGQKGTPFYTSVLPTTINDATSLKLLRTEALGDSVKMEYTFS